MSFDGREFGGVDSDIFRAKNKLFLKAVVRMFSLTQVASGTRELRNFSSSYSSLFAQPISTKLPSCDYLSTMGNTDCPEELVAQVRAIQNSSEKFIFGGSVICWKMIDYGACHLPALKLFIKP